MSDNINITPEMINNLIKNFSTSSSSENENSSTGTENDFSNNTNKDDSSNSSFNNIDFDTIMKIKNIMEIINKKDDPDSKLLYSLKPYLRKSRQDKLDQYVNILKFTHISKMFK